MVHFNLINSMQKFAVFSLISCLLVVTSACSWFSKKTEPQLVIINVLSLEDYEDCHITGSIHVSFDDIEDTIKSFDKQNSYVIYCADYACMASGYVAKLMQEQGFEHVWEYAGGMNDWFNKGLPVEGPCKKAYLHAENVKLDDEDADHGVQTLTAEQLHDKIKEFETKK